VLCHLEALGPQHLGLLKDCQVLSPFIYSKVDHAVFEAAPGLRLVATRSTGVDHIDVAEAKARGVAVANVPEYGSHTVAEHTLALMLALAHRLPASMRALREGHIDPMALRGFDVQGKVLGVVGTGRIGSHVIQMARGFVPQVLAYDARPDPRKAEALGFEYAPLERLLKESDILTLHCPAGPGPLLGEGEFAAMKPGAVLINTARGSLVDTQALLRALESGHLAGAGLDVYEGEQVVKEEAQLLARGFHRDDLLHALQAHRLMQMDNVIMTPHNAFNSREAVDRILGTSLATIAGFFKP
jgi:D-lactate dehydrogenase